MDYLAEAKKQIDFVEVQTSEEAYQQYGPVASQIATACALVALVKRLDALTEFGGDKSLYVITTRATTR